MVLGRLKQYIDSKGITVAAFERSIGMSNASFGKTLKQGKSIGSDKLEKILLIYPDLNPSWLLTGEGDMVLSKTPQNASIIITDPLYLCNTPVNTQTQDDAPSVMIVNNVFPLRTDRRIEIQTIPLYDLSASAGLTELFSNEARRMPVCHISLPDLPSCEGAVYVRGDSMYPLLKSGDIVLYKEVNDLTNGIFWGEMYLLSLSLNGEEYVTIKYLQKSNVPGFVRLVSQNIHHAPKDVPLSGVRALALVKASVRYNTMR